MPTSNRKRYLDSLVAESSRNSNRARTYSDRRRQLDEIVKTSEQNTARRAEAAQRNTTVPTPTAKSPNATMDRNALRRNATAEGYRQNMERKNTAQYDASEQEMRKPQTTVQSTSKAGQVAELAATKALEAQSVKMRADDSEAREKYYKWNKLDDNAKKLANTAYSSAWDVSLDERIAAEHELKSKYNMTDKDLKDVRKGRKYERRYADSLLEDERLSKMYNDLGTEGQELLRTYGNKGVQLLGGQELASESRHAENELRTKYKLNDQDLSQLSVYAEQYENQQKYNAEDTIKEAQERARKHPIRTSAETIVSNVLGNAMSAVGQGVEAANLARLRQSGYDVPVSIDRNNPLFAATRYTNEARKTVADEKIDSRIGSFLYQTGMSAIDSGVAAGIGAMFPAGSIGQLSLSLGGTMLGVGAGTSTMLDLADKGASAETALLGGLVSGTLEMLFEDVSISQLSTFKKTEAAAFKSGLSKAAIKDNLKLLARKWGATTFTNATEEGFTEIANLIYDTAVNGDFSQYKEYYNDAIKNGITDPAQAQLYAIKNMTMQVLEATAGGALMGMGFGAGGAVKLGVDYRMQNRGATRLGNMISADSGRADVINTAEAMPEGSESRELLNKYQNSKKGLTSNRLGRLAVANEEFLMGADEDTVKKVEAARRDIIQTKAGEAQRNFDRFELNNAVVGTDKSGREIRMVDANANKQGAQAKIFSKGANGALTFKTSDGKTQELNKQTVTRIQNADARELAKFALDNKLGAEGANLLFDSYNPETLTGDHEAAFLRVYRQGALGTSSKALFGNYGDDMRQFTAEQQQKILNAGLAEKETKPGATDWRVYTKNDGFVSLQIKAMDTINKALNREIYIVDDLYETYTAKDAEGNEKESLRYLNGQYLKDSGKIILSAKADKGLLLSFLAHEMGHEMKVNDDATYQRLVNLVKSQYKGDEWEKQLDKFVEQGYDKSDAEEELVCNSLFDVFDKNTIKQIFGKDKAAAVRAYKVLDRISQLYSSAVSKYAGELNYKGEYKHGDIKKLQDNQAYVEATRELFAEYLGKYAAGEYEGVKNNEAVKNSISDRDTRGRELSEAQRDFFKDSKAVDENGNLVRLLHGSENLGFMEFDNTVRDKGEFGYYASPNYNVAFSYAGSSDTWGPARAESWDDIKAKAEKVDLEVRENSDGTYDIGSVEWTPSADDYVDFVSLGTVKADDLKKADKIISDYVQENLDEYGEAGAYEVYYNLKNPYIIDGGGSNWDEVREYYEGYDWVSSTELTDEQVYKAAEAVQEMYPGSVLDDIGDVREMDVDELREMLPGDDEPGHNYGQNYGVKGDEVVLVEPGMSTREWVDEIRNWGADYDGVIFKNITDNGPHEWRGVLTDVYVAFSPNQIKSVNNLNPTAEDNDIRYSISDRNEQEMVNRLGKNAEVQTDDKGNLVLATDKDHKTAMYSVRTWKDSGRDALANLLRAKGHTQAEIDDQLKTIDDAADYLQILAAGFAENEGYHDLSQHLVADVTTDVAHGKQVVSALVPNGEYPVNIDLALICKKRVAYMKLITRLIDDGVMENVRFGGDAIADVNAILRDAGFETACLGCFVESRRLQIQTWAETIAQEWNAAVDKVRKNAPYFNFAQKGKESAGNLTQEEMDDLDEWLSKQKLNDQGNVKTGGRSPLARAEGLLQMVAESGDGKALDAIAKKITVGDLLTPQGLTEMKRIKGGSNIISFVKSRYGSNTPKIVQEYNPYNSEIAIMTAKAVADLTGKSITGLSVYRDSAKKALADSKPKPKDKEAKAKWDADVEHLALQNYFKDIGGIRIQSFSDFMIENVFDYLQIVADLAAQDFSMHGYSKEITALRLFGMTGIKWNGSFIAHVDPKMGKEYAGLMPASEAEAGRGIPVELDGKKYTICMDDYERHNKYDKNSYIQSIGYKDMIALQCDKRYAPYVGSITIGVSDNQIRAMLRSDYFRMVIPYHSSGMNPIFAQLMGVDHYTDYTDYQNTRLAQLYDVDGNEVDTLGEDIEPDHFLFNAKVQELGDAKAAADAYLAWCAGRHEVKKGDEVIGYATYEPKFSKFSNEENYYKLLEDFNVYDSITGESAIQGGAKMILPSADNKLSDAELEEYKQRLRETKLFSEKEINKYAAKAQQTFQEIVQDAVQERATYNKDVVVPKFDDTVSQIEKLLTDKYSRETKAAKGVYQTVNSNNWGVPQVGLGNIANTSVSGNAKASISDRGDVADYEAEQYLENASAEEIKAIVDEVDRRMQNAPYFEDKQEQTEVYAILDKMREKRDRLYEALSMDTGNESLTEYNRNTRNELFGEAEPEGTIEGNKLIGKGQRQNINKADAEKLIKRYKRIHHDRGAPLSLENLDEATAKLQQFYEDMQNNPNMAWDDVFEKAKDVAVEIVKYTKYHKEVHHPGKVYQTTETVRYDNVFGDYIDTLGRHNRRSGEFVLTASDELLAPIINDIVTDYFDVPVSNADAVKTANLKTTYKNQIQSLKNQIRAIQKEHRAELKRKVKEQKLADDIYYKRRMQEIRADRDQKLLAQRIAYQQSQQNRREKTAQRELKGKILRRYQRLDQELRKPNGNRYVPKDLVNTVAGVLSQITETLQTEEYYQTGREIKSHIAQNKKLAELKVVYDSMQGNEQYSSYYDPVISEMMQAVADNTKGKTINEMNVSELQQVYNLMTALDHTVRNAAKVEIAGKEHDAFKIADRNIDQLKEVKAKKINRFTKYWYDQMNARSFFRQLSGYTEGGWMDMYEMLNEGQLKQSAIKAEVTEAFRELTSDKQARDLMDTKKLYDVGLKDAAGKPIKLTKGMVLAIYMHLQNEQNVRHIAEGGLTVPDLEKYYKGDREAYGTDVTYSSGVAGELRQLNMQINELEKNRTDANAAETDAKIETLEAKKEAAYEKADALMDNLRMQIEKQLTDYDRAWIEKAKWFFDEYSKSKLNEATMQMYGFTKANENNYFPIKVDRDMVAPNFEGLKRDITLEASGFMKERQKGAANAIYLEDMVDVIKRQMNNVAAYSGLAPAIKNFNKVYGKSKADDQGNIATVTSVQKAVNSAFGQYGKKYIADLLTDLQGGNKSEPSIISELRGNAYQAALTLNMRVAMAQAGSYPTAAAEIGWKPLMKALRHGGEKNTVLSKADRELIAKYTPLLANRVNGGNATVDLNNLKTLSAHSRQGVNARILQKTAAVTDWISKVDAATVGRLWYAAQYYVDDNSKLEKGTDEYYQEVAKVFNRIVERTQPSYTTMQRSALLRNPNEAVKLFTMYMTQRGQNYNLLYDSIMEYKTLRDGAKNGTVSKDKLNKSAVNLRRTVSSQLAAGLTLSAMKIVADAIQHNMKGYRDDDDDEVKAGKILEKLSTTWLESELSNVFLGSEIYSFADRCITGEPYYGISVNVVGAAEDFAKDLKNMISSPSAKSVDRVFRDAATIMGIPASQMNKFANMGKYWFEDIKDGGGIYSNYEGNETNKQMAGKMVSAYLRGDMAQYRTRSEALNGKSDTSVKSAITSYVEEQVLAGKMSEPEARRVFINVYGKSEKETDKKLEEIRQKKAGTYEKKESKKWGG